MLASSAKRVRARQTHYMHAHAYARLLARSSTYMRTRARTSTGMFVRLQARAHVRTFALTSATSASTHTPTAPSHVCMTLALTHPSALTYRLASLEHTLAYTCHAPQAVFPLARPLHKGQVSARADTYAPTVTPASADECNK